MTDTDDTPQSNSQSNQNFDPDVRKMFKHFVTGGNTPNDNETHQNIGIDDIRGQVSATVTSSPTENLIKALNINPSTNTIATTPNTVAPTQLAQESRCHAFYRIIGFPVINSAKKDFYNPGFDIIIGTNIKRDGTNIKRKIDMDRKLGIAKNIDKDFEKLSEARETYAAQTSKIFSVPTSVEAGVLALTSGTYGKNGNVNKRDFAQPFKSTEPFDFSIEAQSYSSPGDITSTYSLVGNREVFLSDYQSINADPANGYKPKPGLGGNDSVLFGHKHIIKPFMVDPRIDFSIWASESKTSSGVSKRIAVPFVPNASFLKTSNTATAERPLLEKIITDRFATPTVQEAGVNANNVINYVKGIKSIQSITIGSSPISGIFSGSVYKLSQQQAFAQTVSTIQSLMFKLVDSMRIVHARQGDYYWLPIPSTLGPEGGCSVRDVPLSENVDKALLTPADFDIIEKQIGVLLSNLTSASTQSTATPDVGSYAFSNYKLTFDSSTSDSQGSLSAQSQNTMVKTRDNLLEQGSDALQIIEMIMGEFSGLGLCDIVAIMGALYVMPLNDPDSKGTGNLLGFLDEDAIVRAEVILKQPAGSLVSVQSGIVPAMTSLSNTVNSFYQIMDKIFQDYMNNKALDL